jgi:putative membrane protein
VTAPSPAGSLVQFLCTSFGSTGAGSGSGIWTFDLWITLPLMFSLALYGVGTFALWRRAGMRRGIRLWRVGCYAAGWLMLAVALVSPIHHWGTELFAVHMVEHELVMAVAAPLIALAQPGRALTWTLPAAARRQVGSVVRGYWLRGGRAALTRPGAATILHGVAIWAWHVPILFEAALASVALHRLQHVSFLITGLLFWLALVRCRNAGVAAAHLCATMLHTSTLGALVALAPRVLYRLQTEGAVPWGLTPLEDQQLAGLIMWIPAGGIYAAAALLFFAVWVRQSGGGATRQARISRFTADGGYRSAAE